MGKEKTTTETTTKATPTPEEQEMQRLQLEQYKQLVGPQTQLQQQGMDLISKMFAGGGLPGYFGEMAAGISPEAIGNQASQLTRQYMPGFQQMGLGDSGVAFRETARGIANELLFPAEQYNIGAKQNLLNLALSGQAQVQQPIQAQTGTLASSLAGLRTVSQSGTTTGMNPFLKSFQTGLGTGLGTGLSNWVNPQTYIKPCWVASEIFGGWYEPKTCMARLYINELAPKWFKNFYLKYGERIAKFIHNKPVFKILLRPLFELFAYSGKVSLMGRLV